MTPRQKRMTLVAVIVAGVAVASTFALLALRSNVSFYFDPSRVAAGEVQPGKKFRLGGMVVKGSVQRRPGTLDVSFLVTDFCHSVPVRYDKLLPNLFKEGTGVVADGRLDANGTFTADEVLAKHDENYMPPAMAKSLDAARQEPAGKCTTSLAAGGAPAATGG